MKNFIVILIGLFILSGCSKSNDDDKEGDRVTYCGLYMRDIMKNYHITDTFALDVYNISSNSSVGTILIGIKNKKLWVAQHDDANGILVNTYISSMNYEFDRKIHINYDNYDHIYTQNLNIENITPTEHGFIFTIPLSRNYPDAVSDICFIHDKTITIQNNVNFAFVFPWYDGGIFTTYTRIDNAYASVENHPSCYFNYKGDKLFESAIFLDLETAKSVIPINENEIVGFCKLDKILYTTNVIARINLKEKEILWESNPYKNITGDFIIKGNVLKSKNDRYFEYNSKIVYQNGEIKTMHYKISIETGEITEI
ncbi:hypothetical protein [Butyricimonas paravirosa]|uniref:hypothetical protein n=1 Tax=Butyricimonas paravirosa TaxID=1472417 RepID=UPI0026DF476A|nr:hypothetical protein [Butyricimonas paravirosa]